MIDRGEDGLVAPSQGLVLELEVLGQRHEDRLHSGSRQLVIERGHVLRHGDLGKRRRVDRHRHSVQRGFRIADDDATRRRAGEHDPGTDEEDRADRERGAGKAGCHGERSQVVCG